MMISGNQCRAARAWLRLETQTLARCIGCSRDTIRRFENGEAARSATVEAIRAFLEKRGIVFVFSRDGKPMGIEEK